MEARRRYWSGSSPGIRERLPLRSTRARGAGSTAAAKPGSALLLSRGFRARFELELRLAVDVDRRAGRIRVGLDQLERKDLAVYARQTADSLVVGVGTCQGPLVQAVPASAQPSCRLTSGQAAITIIITGKSL